MNKGIKDGTVRHDVEPVKATLIMTSYMMRVLTPVIEMYLKINNLTYGELIDSAIDSLVRVFEEIRVEK
ncbi:MAG: hypothetical protein ACPK85_15025 [Methanosarcina sp.]